MCSMYVCMCVCVCVCVCVYVCVYVTFHTRMFDIVTERSNEHS